MTRAVRPGLRRLVLDLSPLRDSPGYRRLWAGQAVSVIGTQLTRVALPYQAYLLTHSSLVVGLISLAQLVPLLVCSLLGGSIADSFDRRKLMIGNQSALAVLAAGLGAVSLLDRPPLWPLFVLTAISAAVSAVDSPARSAAVAALVRRDQFTAAAALNQTLFQAGLIIGPALAGALIATAGVGPAYWIDAATFVVSVLVVAGMQPLPPRHEGHRPGFRSVGEGLRYLRGRQALQGSFLADIDAMVFGMPRALFPAIAVGHLGGGALTLGLLHAAPGVGALVGSLTSGWVAHVHRQGRAIVVAVMVWGAAITLFGLAPALWLALPALVVAGAADVLSAVFRQTVLQLSVPDRLRGRLSALNIAVVQGGPLLGDGRAGAVASLGGPVFSLVGGGVACMAAMGLLAWRLPALRRWTLDDAVPEPDR